MVQNTIKIGSVDIETQYLSKEIIYCYNLLNYFQIRMIINETKMEFSGLYNLIRFLIKKITDENYNEIKYNENKWIVKNSNTSNYFIINLDEEYYNDYYEKLIINNLINKLIIQHVINNNVIYYISDFKLKNMIWIDRTNMDGIYKLRNTIQAYNKLRQENL